MYSLDVWASADIRLLLGSSPLYPPPSQPAQAGEQHTVHDIQDDVGTKKGRCVQRPRSNKHRGESGAAKQELSRLGTVEALHDPACGACTTEPEHPPGKPRLRYQEDQ